MKLNYLEHILEKITLRKFIIIQLSILFVFGIGVFCISNYKTIYKTIYNERIEKIKNVDNLVIDILKYENSLVKRDNISVMQAQARAVEMINAIQFKDEYIWIDDMFGKSIYHPIPSYASNIDVDRAIEKIVNERGEGYLQYQWKKLSGGKDKLYSKVSYVKAYKDWGWIIGNGVYIDDIKYKVITSMLKGIVRVLLFFIIVVAILQYTMIKAIANPIDRLAKISERLGEGDLKVVIPMTESNTELGKLYKIFNKFLYLFETEKRRAEKENLLRTIIEKIRSSLDVEETLSFICEETAKVFNVQRTAITIFPDKNNFQKYEIRKEYTVRDDIKSFSDSTESSRVAEYWAKSLINDDKMLAIDNILESDAPDYFKNSYNELGAKSIIGIAIKRGECVWGTLILSEYDETRRWRDDEKALLKAIAGQVYIAINQAELYENQKSMVEREKISRNIVEILRSSIDKKIIKKLFVKNIRKFFDADRVLLSEFDENKNIYLPVDEDSESLSDFEKNSLVGYNFTNSEVRELMRPLLEKRELNICCLDEYLQQNPTSLPLIDTFRKFNIKSSYNFPILYQQKLMGFFCIDFSREEKRLSEEDINRLRNMCTQAGIALYHSNLYKKAQNCIASREDVEVEIYEKIKVPAKEILENSTILYENEFERSDEMKYLANMISSCHELLELTENT